MATKEQHEFFKSVYDEHRGITAKERKEHKIEFHAKTAGKMEKNKRLPMASRG
jgi:hypothetical protein